MTTTAATKLTPTEQKELAEARAKISVVEDEAQRHLTEHREAVTRHAALTDEILTWRKDLEARLTELRQGILVGKASLGDLEAALRDLHTVALLEADFARQHDGMGVWDRLVQRPQARAVNAGAAGMHSRRVVARLTAKQQAKP